MSSTPSQPSTPSTPGPAPTAAPRRYRPGVFEGLAALSVLLALSGVLMPAIGEEVVESRENAALSDLHDIAAGLAGYARDTHFLPTGVEGRTNVAWLYGPGNVPAGNPFSGGGEARPLDDALLNDSMGRSQWAGPYTTGLHADPWGHCYLVNVEGWLTETETAMVLSAGPDGVVQTQPDAWQPAGDDLMLVVN